MRTKCANEKRSLIYFFFGFAFATGFFAAFFAAGFFAAFFFTVFAAGFFTLGVIFFSPCDAEITTDPSISVTI